MKRLVFTLAVILLFSAYASVHAEIVVVSTKGEAAAFISGNWKPLAAGAKIAEGTKVSTGTNSSIVFRIDEHIVTLGPVSSVKVYKNMKSGSSSDTSLGLQYGTVRAKVKKTASVKTRFNITTPVATSSVRGTEEIVSYGARSGMMIEVVEGSISAHNDRGVGSRVSGRERFSLRHNSSRPDSVNAFIRDGATVSLTPPAVTKEEREAADRTGGEILFADQGNTPAAAKTHVSIVIDVRQ